MYLYAAATPPPVDMGFDLTANNLCSLCFKVPEFVLPSFPHYSKNNSRGLQKWSPLPKRIRASMLVPIIWCSFCFKVPQFVFRYLENNSGAVKFYKFSKIGLEIHIFCIVKSSDKFGGKL